MEKEVKFDGYTAVPGDYECQDGELSLSVNLLKEDGGGLRGIGAPKPIGKVADGDRVLMIHKVDGNKRNWIVARRKNATQETLCWMSVGTSCEDNDTSKAMEMEGVALSDLSDLKSIGNTLVAATSTGLFYILWAEGGYKALGLRPPFVAIDFACNSVEIGKSELATQKSRIRGYCLAKWGVYKLNDTEDSIDDKAQWTLATDAIMGPINKAIRNVVTSKGRFHMPFFVRYAYRLYDGSYYWHSAPILMLPNVIPPEAYVYWPREGDTVDWNKEVQVSVNVKIPCYELRYRALYPEEMKAELERWSDIVAGIDIFVSSPIYSYEQDKDVDEGCRVSSAYGRIVSICDVVGELQMGDTDNHASNASLTIEPQIATDFVGKVCSTSLFYRIAKIDIDDLKQTEDLEPIEMEQEDLGNLETRPRLDDDYQSHATVVSKTFYEFNSRLHLANNKMIPSAPYPLRSTFPYKFESYYWDGSKGDDLYKNITVRVYLRYGAQKVMTYYWASTENSYEGFLPRTWPNMRWFYYPDANAYKMEIWFDGKRLMVSRKLIPHQMLNGAYFFIPKMSAAEEQEAEPLQGLGSSVSIGEKIYSSEVQNPFVFKPEGIVSVGGEVMAVSSATKALSQGQFGQFPLYAFTDRGVWALQTNAEGRYTSVHPTSRDVCLSADSIAQLDDSVMFGTARGLMQLSGSQASCVTEAIDNVSALGLDDVPRLGRLGELQWSGFADWFGVEPLKEMVGRAKMTWDYKHQRLMVYEAENPLMLVLSLQTGRWGMRVMGDGLSASYGINAYPDSYGVDSEGRIVDYGEETAEDAKVLLLTRPLKLDGPDVMKTLDTIIGRGFGLRYGGVALWGSRDLSQWHLIWSGTGSRMRGLRGTPYKYFRVGLIGEVEKAGRLHGISVGMTPRFMNKLR